MFASENKLGVSKSDTYELITFLSPLPKKLNCQTLELIKAHVEDEYVKSVTGGVLVLHNLVVTTPLHTLQNLKQLNSDTTM